MNKLVALVQTAGDRMNPVAVKEFRQAVQSNWVVTILMLFLLINLSVIGGYLLLSPTADTSIDAGRNVFSGLLAILMITCLGFVPLYSGVRMSLERNEMHTDLFFVTTITPGSIVRGKYLTAMALTLLIFSACMPFMVLTYLLRGIDLPTIFLVLGWGFLICAVANAMGIFAGSVAGSWLIRGLVDLVMLNMLFGIIVVTIGMTADMLRIGWRGVFSSAADWAGFGSSVLLAIVAIGLLYVVAVAMLSPKPSNRMLVPRVYITASWAITAVILVLWGYFMATLAPLAVWAVGSGVTLTILVVTSLGERDTWSARVRRTIPRNPLLRRLAFLFYTGSAGGVLWCMLLFIATMLVVLSCSALIERTFPPPAPSSSPSMYVPAGPPGSRELFAMYDNLPFVFGYFLCYCLTTVLLRVTVLRNVATPVLPVVAGFLGVIAWLIPSLIAFFVEHNLSMLIPWYLLGSPVVLTTDDPNVKNVAGVLVLIWLIPCLVLSAPWFIGQWRRFAPYQTQPAGTTEA